MAEFVTERQAAKGKRGGLLQVASLNRELQVLRRMFHLAQEWGRVQRALPSVKILPGEKHRERVLTPHEEDLYFRGASSDAMDRYADGALLRDVASILLDCGLRSEECFRLRTVNVKKQDVELALFELYTLRHTCLTRCAPHMDPWTLAYLAGHRDMNITKRYVHPKEQTVRAAMDRVQEEKTGHTSGHTAQN